MSKVVGNHLKKLYREGNYAKVNLSKIKMSTKGMDNKGDVIYQISIPIILVEDSCKAATAFDHRGGWNHEITKAQALNPFKAKRNVEFIELKTPEGLQEFWIQWQHEKLQKHCH